MKILNTRARAKAIFDYARENIRLQPLDPYMHRLIDETIATGATYAQAFTAAVETGAFARHSVPLEDLDVANREDVIQELMQRFDCHRITARRNVQRAESKLKDPSYVPGFRKWGGKRKGAGHPQLRETGKPVINVRDGQAVIERPYYPSRAGKVFESAENWQELEELAAKEVEYVNGVLDQPGTYPLPDWLEERARWQDA